MLVMDGSAKVDSSTPDTDVTAYTILHARLVDEEIPSMFSNRVDVSLYGLETKFSDRALQEMRAMKIYSLIREMASRAQSLSACLDLIQVDRTPNWRVSGLLDRVFGVIKRRTKKTASIVRIQMDELTGLLHEMQSRISRLLRLFEECDHDHGVLRVYIAAGNEFLQSNIDIGHHRPSAGIAAPTYRELFARRLATLNTACSHQQKSVAEFELQLAWLIAMTQIADRLVHTVHPAWHAILNRMLSDGGDVSTNINVPKCLYLQSNFSLMLLKLAKYGDSSDARRITGTPLALGFTESQIRQPAQ